MVATRPPEIKGYVYLKRCSRSDKAKQFEAVGPAKKQTKIRAHVRPTVEQWIQTIFTPINIRDAAITRPKRDPLLNK